MLHNCKIFTEIWSCRLAFFPQKIWNFRLHRFLAFNSSQFNCTFDHSLISDVVKIQTLSSRFVGAVKNFFRTILNGSLITLDLKYVSFKVLSHSIICHQLILSFPSIPRHTITIVLMYPYSMMDIICFNAILTFNI